MNNETLGNVWKVMRQHHLEIIDDVSNDFRCTICKRILIDACNTPCGCRFCLDCIKEYLKDASRTCPGESEYCKTQMISFDHDIQHDRPINMKISKFKSKCPNCRSEIELKMMTNHLRTCNQRPQSCPYVELGCEQCNLVNDEIQQHLLTEISSHSQMMLAWMINSRNETKSLKADLKKLSKDNDELKSQIRKDKENTDKVIRKLHMNEKKNSTEIRILNEKMSELKNSNRSINDELRKLKMQKEQQLSEVNTQVNNQNKEIEKFKQRCEWVESKCEKILFQSEKSHEMDKISQACDALKAETMEISKSIENIREIMDDTVSSEFYWTINNWTMRLENARNGKETLIYSDPLYTHKKGYKFSLFLSFPDFDDDDRDFWISLIIEEGSFDDSLRWPFNRDLELSIINPITELDHKIMTERLLNL